MFKRTLLPFFVCFSFCPNGEPKSVLIAQTHGQKVILYLPSVVPSFVYLLLNCLRRTDVFRVVDRRGQKWGSRTAFMSVYLMVAQSNPHRDHEGTQFLSRIQPAWPVCMSQGCHIETPWNDLVALISGFFLVVVAIPQNWFRPPLAGAPSSSVTADDPCESYTMSFYIQAFSLQPQQPWLLFQRTWVRLQAPTWWLTAFCNRIWCPFLACRCTRSTLIYLMRCLQLLLRYSSLFSDEAPGLGLPLCSEKVQLSYWA